MGNEHKGPLAESIKELDGDYIGNNSTHLWRCLLCEGRFIAPDVESFQQVRVGLILREYDNFDELATEPPSELDLWKAAAYEVGINPCRCGYHARWWREAFMFRPKRLFEDEDQ
jgi:hypothetical protein